MRAGLNAFGTDFGNGAREQQFFQRDVEFDRYVAAKSAVDAGRHGVVDDTDVRAALIDRALAFCAERLRDEHCVVVDDRGSRAERCARLALLVQEDFAVMHRGDNDVGDTVVVNVCFPSGWRPERLLGTTFQTIHGPVPAFTDKLAVAQSMVRSMVERGPYVRFVWTCSADDILDHHPEQGTRLPHSSTSPGFLRVERQVTMPFTELGGALFLIRTYVYPFASLSTEQKQTLSTALSAMSDEIAAYKGLLAGRPHLLDLLKDG